MSGIAWRGVVTEDGQIWAWPMVLLDHQKAFVIFSHLNHYRARWRQWDPGGRIEFDPGASNEDKQRVQVWVENANQHGTQKESNG